MPTTRSQVALALIDECLDLIRRHRLAQNVDSEPRADDGKWTSGAGSGASVKRAKVAEKAQKKVDASKNDDKSAHGKSLKGYQASQPLFVHFQEPDGVKTSGWTDSKWGSHYLEGEYADGTTFKLSVRDHDVSNLYDRPDATFRVSQDWNPKEVHEALSKAEDYLRKESEKHPAENHPDNPDSPSAKAAVARGEYERSEEGQKAIRAKQEKYVADKKQALLNAQSNLEKWINKPDSPMRGSAISTIKEKIKDIEWWLKENAE